MSFLNKNNNNEDRNIKRIIKWLRIVYRKFHPPPKSDDSLLQYTTHHDMNGRSTSGLPTVGYAHRRHIVERFK